MVLRVGLTGGIGSGKTMVANICEVLGIPVYYADLQAKRIMNEDEILRSAIIQHFGDDAYINYQLNRPYIASLVFNNKEKLALLNSIVHPVTIHDSNRWMQLQSTPYALKEAALLFEGGGHLHLDYIIGVYAPLNLRVQRVTARDNVSPDEVRRRIANQMNEEEKMSRCDVVITNDEQQLLTTQVLNVHQQLLELSAVKSA